ncbi:MAG: hypothetical protein LC750_00205 [Actinobacteria bacterium]|nr:hypothetical protein [Actinomycetota bacterium]
MTTRAADLVKQVALSTGHKKHREHVLDELWPDLPVERGNAQLRKAIHTVRKAIDDDAIGIDNALVTLRDCGTDVDDFVSGVEGALRSGTAEAATALHLHRRVGATRKRSTRGAVTRRSRSCGTKIVELCDHFHGTDYSLAVRPKQAAKSA